MIGTGHGGILVALLITMVPVPAFAQTLAQRLAASPDGVVRFSFAARPGVCGHGRNISDTRNDPDWESDCDDGPVRVTMNVRSGQPTSLKTYVGGRWRSGSDVTDWGTVPARAAADFLLTIATSQSTVAEKAVFPATLADSLEAWPQLLVIARDRTLRTGARKQAVFWLGQAAGAAATQGLDSLMSDETLDRPVQEQVVFALSQRPKGEGVPALIRVARTHRDPEVRKKAMFWLGQSDDPRALALFEELLTR
jgi:hypothetical protein